MINIDNKKDCCGCTACASACPKGAINMIEDEMGFKYPQIDFNLCVDCSLCDRICVFTKSKITHPVYADYPIAYAARHKNLSEIETSRSGATFIALTNYVFLRGGVVYGVGYGEHFRAVHKRALNKMQVQEFKGSKYVQSDLEGIFPLVKKDLKAGKFVLVSGTPCQLSGLKSYVGKLLLENLLLVDIVCHGVPSPKVWDDYLTYLEHKHNAKIVKVDFRDKSELGWKAHVESIQFENSTSKLYSKVYTDLFYEHVMLRPSCSNCRYTTIYRESDVTLADFWGWQKSVPHFNIDDKGCSLVLVNSPKGNIVFQEANHDLNVIEVNLDNCMQHNLQNSSIFSSKVALFEKRYLKSGFAYVLQHQKSNRRTKKVQRVFRLPLTALRKIFKWFCR